MLYKKRRKYKYNLHSEETHDTKYNVAQPIALEFLTFDVNGKLTVKEGYSWDGPSGPTIDTPNFMRGSLVHDALYQLMREGKLPQDFRKKADKILRDICRSDGMSKLRAWVVYKAVRAFGASSAKSDMLSAP